MSTAAHASGRRFALPPGCIDAAAIAAMIAVPLWSFHSSFGGLGFFAVGLCGVAASLAVIGLARILDWPMFITAVALIVVYPITGAMFVLPFLNVASVIPTPASLSEVVATTINGWKVLVTVEPPVGSIDGLFILPYAIGYWAAAALYATSRRRSWRYLAMVIPGAILALGIFTGTSTPVAPTLMGVGVVGIAAAWLSWHEHRRRPAVELPGRRARRGLSGVLFGVFAVAVGAASATALPVDSASRVVWRQYVVPPFDPRSYPSPLAGYRQYVKLATDASPTQKSDRVMFTVSGLPFGVSMRLATMDTYDGLVWQVGNGGNRQTLQESSSFQRVGTDVSPDLSGGFKTIEVTVTIAEYADVWVPTVGEVIALRFSGSADGPGRDRELQRSLRYNRATDTAATPVGLHRGDRYEMRVALPIEQPDVASATIDADRRVGQAVAVPSLVQALANPALLATNNTSARLETVRSEMYRTGVYTDGDPTSGQVPARAGHSAGRLSGFVGDYPRRPLIGNAEQFAASYSLLFRQLGDVPTRVVMGFEADRGSLTEPLDIMQTDVEAWAEVPLNNGGWLWVDPTPPRDQKALTVTAPQQPAPEYRTQQPEPPAIVDPDFDAAATTEGDATDEPDQRSADEQSDTDGPTSDRFSFVAAAGTAAIVGGAPVLIAAGIASLIVALKLGRRMVRRRRGDGNLRVANGWNEIEDLSLDLGNVLEPGSTRRENAVVVGSAAVALAERTDATVWSTAEVDDAAVERYWETVDATLRSLRSELAWTTRARAALSLRSLRYRLRGRRRP